MKKYQKTTFILLIIFFANCEKKVDELEFERSVMTEIFPDLIDSICIDSRTFKLPPPVGKAIYDKDDNYVGRDTTNIKSERENWKKEINRIENDTSKIIIAFDPKLEKSRDSLKNYFEKNFSNTKIFKAKTESKTNYILDFKNIKLNGKFELKNISEFPKERGVIWEIKYNFLFSGVVSFSRIEFDKEKKFGILNGGFYCGRLCGQGFRIYIKKVNEKWIIDKIEATWIS
jgi:hypothetical protein